MKKHTKAIVLILIMAVLIGYNSYINRHVQLREHLIYSKKLPSSFDDFRIVQIADLHSIKDVAFANMLIDAIKKQRPDILVITGDLIDSGVYLEECKSVEQGGSKGIPGQLTLDFVAELVEMAPVYFVYGNHEMVLLDNPEKNSFKVALESLGVLFANNKSFVLSRGTDSINLLGIQDPSTLYKDPVFSNRGENSKERTQFMMDAVTENIDGQLFTVLLAHRPEFFELYASYSVDLALTGHAHGGQIRIPFRREGLYAPNQGFFPAYTNGLYTSDSFEMIVSRGLGNSIFPLRIFNGLELSVAVLTNNVNDVNL